MRGRRLNDTIAALCLLCFGFASFLVGDEISLLPLQDTTIFQENGSLQNGAGAHLFSGATAGRNGGAPRRLLLSFDVAGNLPAGAVVTGATLSMTVNRVPGGAVENQFGLHRLTQQWIPGTGDANGQEGRGIAAGDGATWTTTGSADWETPGGDFVEAVSSAALVGSRDVYVWPSTETLVGDLQAWLDAPDSNFGWILIGDEETMRTAKRFASSVNPTEADRPTLTIEFESMEGLVGDFDQDGELLDGDIDLLCGAVLGGEHPAEFDLTGDGLVDLEDHRFWVEDVRGTFFGDVDLDGEVRFSDFLIHSSRFGQFPAEGGRWALGDFNCDSIVDFADFLLISQNFGRSSEGVTVAASAVPEPSSAVMMLLGLLAIHARRRR